MAENTNPQDPQHGHGDSHGHPPPENADVSFERTDVDYFQVSAFGIGLLISTIVVAFGIIGLFNFLTKHENAKNPAPIGNMAREKDKLPPRPHIQPVPGDALPRVQLQDLRASEDQLLTHYGWIDEGKGIVRIPISQAIDMVAAKGLPTKAGAMGGDVGGYRMIPSDASSGRTLEKISQ